MHNMKTNRTDEQKKLLVSRLNKIEGQFRGISKMLDENRYCTDILIQLSAVDKAIKSLASLILNSHLHSCVIDSIENKNFAVMDEIMDLFKRFQ